MTAITVAKDLSANFGLARDQGPRPTCLAFAVSDAHAALRAPWAELSSEYIFYHSQRRAGRGLADGALLSPTLEALSRDGQPLETLWTYAKVLPLDVSSWLPPSGVTVFRRASNTPAASINAILKVLDDGRPVVLLINLAPVFFSAKKDVLDLIPGSPPDPNRRHAVVAVAHGTGGGKRAVLVRNSWGSAWGVGGYAWLTEALLEKSLFGIAILEGELDVSGNPVTT